MRGAPLPLCLSLCLCAAALLVTAQSVTRVIRRLEDNGGHYMGGSLQWRHSGSNRVEFSLRMTWRRNYSSSYFKGSAPDSLSAVGDAIVLNGKSWPTLSFGDGEVQQYLSMSVLSYSTAENWVHGVATATHTYTTPNNAGSPWVAVFQGCCRVPSLNSVVDSDATFSLAASLDLLLAAASPTVADVVIAYIVDPVTQGATHAVALHAHPQQEVSLAFSGIGYVGIDLLINSSSGAVSLRTAPALPLLAGAFNAFQATLRLASPLTPQLYVDIDTLTFLQRARQVPSPPNASSSTAAVSFDAALRVPVFTGQTHTITFRASSALNDALSFDFTGVPPSCSIAAVRRLSATEWGVAVTWPVCDADLGTQFLCATARSASGGVSQTTCLAYAVVPDTPPSFLSPPTNVSFVIGRKQIVRVDVADSNEQHVVSVSVVGLQLLQVDAGSPAAAVSNSIQRGLQSTTTSVQVEWAPAVTMGGAVFQLCFSAATQCGACNCSGAQQSVSLCVTVSVAKCTMEVQRDSSVSSLSRMLGVTWKSLWLLNTDLPHPDFALQPATTLAIGRLVKLPQTRSLADVASTFGCSVETLLLLNNDIRNASAPLPPAASICIIADACLARSTEQSPSSFREQEWFRNSQTQRY